MWSCGCSFTTFFLVHSVPCTWVPGYLGTWVPGYLGTWVPGYLGTWVPGYLGTWVPGYLGTWVPGCLGTWGGQADPRVRLAGWPDSGSGQPDSGVRLAGLRGPSFSPAKRVRPFWSHSTVQVTRLRTIDPCCQLFRYTVH